MVYDTRSDEPIPDALIFLQSTAIDGVQEGTVEPDGTFAFTDLPSGTYTVQVLAGQADASIVTTLVDSGPGFVAEIGLDPTTSRPGCRFGPVEALDVSLFSEKGTKRRY